MISGVQENIDKVHDEIHNLCIQIEAIDRDN